MLSHDTVNHWLGRPLVLPEMVANLLAKWHVTHVFEDIIPELERLGVEDGDFDTILIENPKRLFAGE